jgi:hypothetical protein
MKNIYFIIEALISLILSAMSFTFLSIQEGGLGIGSREDAQEYTLYGFARVREIHAHRKNRSANKPTMHRVFYKGNSG